MANVRVISADPATGVHYTHSDKIVLEDLNARRGHIENGATADQASSAVARLRALNDPMDSGFRPCVFAMFDVEDIPGHIYQLVVQPYIRIASRIVRHPTDVVFLTNILWNLIFTLPSAVILFQRFNWIHGITHALHTLWCMAPFTLMLHNHIHNNGVLSHTWKVLDVSFPYLLQPLLGHTWNSYYFHHVKHHHVEDNGPHDISSTLCYQRDDFKDFLRYEVKFLFLVWIELPLYFLSKGETLTSLKAFSSESISHGFLFYMTYFVDTKASVCVFWIPLLVMRLAMMAGNWGQHAFVDEVDPNHNLRSSITLIDVASNRFAFNDGYHTAHHLNPRRHWRDHPIHLLQHKRTYATGRALIFRDVNFLQITYRLLCKDYGFLACHIVPIGEQVDMTKKELAEMLRCKTKKMT